MNSLEVSTRLMLLIGVLSALLVGIGGLGLFGIGQSNEALRMVYEDRTVPAAQLGEIDYLVVSNRLAINVALQSPTQEVITEQVARVEANIARVTSLFDTYMRTHMTEQEKQIAAGFATARQAFVKDGLLPAVAALRERRLAEAQRLVVERIRPLAAPVEAANQQLIKLQIEEARADYAEANARFATIRWVFVAATLGGLAFAAVFGALLVRSLARQLGAEPAQAAEVARQVAAGRLDVPITLRAGTDGDSLMAQLQQMQQSLAGVVSNVRQNADSVATASAQIAQGNNDLSQRTEQQASALQQTAASMEQLGSTVKQNADSARQANQLALGASQVAVKGGEVVARAVETMKSINDSSRRIADIIGVIDGIAFQTNILALNAAVEAARAGEQGRGFAVVAGEVRSLAGRSAEAAREIKSLITDSVQRVQDGSVLVDQAGSTMTEIVASVQRVTDIIGEISAASAEQSTGLAQVGEAVTQMDRATQQNAALVEESAAAAESLKGQAQQLVSSVAVFALA